jgi:hypothetical protein
MVILLILVMEVVPNFISLGDIYFVPLTLNILQPGTTTVVLNLWYCTHHKVLAEIISQSWNKSS